MKLNVITGYREYLCPAPVGEDELGRFLVDCSQTVHWANVGWSPRAEQPFDVSFVLDRRSAERSLVDLLLEYLMDSHGVNDRVTVVLPIDGLLELDPPKKGGAADGGFIARAAALIGAQDVRVLRLSLSRNADNVLHTLAGMTSAEMRAPSALGALETIQLQPKIERGQPSPYSTMTRNYTKAVLTLCERLVADKLTFSGARRVEFVVNEMARNGLSIHPELPVDRILAALDAGGEIFELLSRPFATAGGVAL